MKAIRHCRLNRSSAARKLSGNPPRTQSRSAASGSRLLNFGQNERRQLEISDPPRQALRRLLKQIDRGRAEKQELSRPDALSAPLVDYAAQNLE